MASAMVIAAHTIILRDSAPRIIEASTAQAALAAALAARARSVRVIQAGAPAECSIRVRCA